MFPYVPVWFLGQGPPGSKQEIVLVNLQAELSDSDRRLTVAYSLGRVNLGCGDQQLKEKSCFLSRWCHQVAIREYCHPIFQYGSINID
jgi:hypothetical protein